MRCICSTNSSECLWHPLDVFCLFSLLPFLWLQLWNKPRSRIPSLQYSLGFFSSQQLGLFCLVLFILCILTFLINLLNFSLLVSKRIISLIFLYLVYKNLLILFLIQKSHRATLHVFLFRINFNSELLWWPISIKQIYLNMANVQLHQVSSWVT